MADVMDVEEAGVMDCYVQAGAELERTQVAPEADAFTFASIAGHASVTVDDAGWALPPEVKTSQTSCSHSEALRDGMGTTWSKDAVSGECLRPDLKG